VRELNCIDMVSVPQLFIECRPFKVISLATSWMPHWSWFSDIGALEISSTYQHTFYDDTFA